MVVHYFDVVRVAILPAKADTPLIVNADTVLSFSVAGERFDVVAGWDAKSFDLSGCCN